MGFWLLAMDILRLGELQMDRLPKEVAIQPSIFSELLLKSSAKTSTCCSLQHLLEGVEIDCLCPSAHLHDCSDQVIDMAQAQQIDARLFSHIDVATSLLLKQDLSPGCEARPKARAGTGVG
jgi:hypothetical protein